jgi:hypothetical protein
MVFEKAWRAFVFVFVIVIVIIIRERAVWHKVHCREHGRFCLLLSDFGVWSLDKV